MGRKEWTKDEETYMYRRYLNQSVETTAKFLNRSVSSVKHKASKMGLNHYYGERISAKTLAKCFHSDISVVVRWIDKYDLPCKKVKLKNQTRYLIDAAEFWKWAENHQDVINWKKDNGKPERHGNKITDFEKLSIKNMLRKGMSNKEIAKEIHRTYEATKHITKTVFC